MFAVEMNLFINAFVLKYVILYVANYIQKRNSKGNLIKYIEVHINIIGYQI